MCLLLDHVERKYCVQLSDPIGRFQTSPMLYNQSISEQRNLFSHHSNIGVLYKGCLRFVSFYKACLAHSPWLQAVQQHLWGANIL